MAYTAVLKYVVISRDPATHEQLSLDDPGVPLPLVTFCVLDLETTGASAEHDRITEIGAAKFRGGEQIGTFKTFVNPECEIPPAITVLTGITQSMVMAAPSVGEILPTLLEFIGDSVIVAHNARFDVGFLNAALLRNDRDQLTNRVLDTVALARRVLRGSVPDCKLATLAKWLRLPHQPSHRALDDALATADLLHVLIERSSGFGVVGLDDLTSLTKLDQHPQASKLRLTEDIPRLPGVYLFLGDNSTVLYVGKATNLRQRVRSYFSTGETRRKVGAMLRQTRSIAHIATPDALTAAIYEARLIARLLPQYNRAGTRSEKYRYLRVTKERVVGDRSTRIKFVNARKVAEEGIHLGPITSRSLAAITAEAIESVLPRFDRVHDEQTHITVDWVLESLHDSPESIAVLIDQRMNELAAEQRYEEAALTRDRLQAFVQCFSRQEMANDVRRAGVLEIRIGNAVHTFDHGVLATTRFDGEMFSPADTSTAPPAILEMLAAPEPPRELHLPVPTAVVDEVLLVARHLRASRGTVLHCSGEWSSRVRRLQDALGANSMSALRKSSSGSRGRIEIDDVVTPLAKY